MFAKRLPVCAIPKQSIITTVRFDVIDHSSRHHFAVGGTHRAQRMFRQIVQTRLLPAVAVPARRAATAFRTPRRSRYPGGNRNAAGSGIQPASRLFKSPHPNPPKPKPPRVESGRRWSNTFSLDHMGYIQLNPCLHIMLRAVYINCQAAFNIFFNRASSNTELTAESRSLYIVRRDTPKSAAI